MTDEATGRRRTRRANGEGSLYFDAKRQRWVAEVSVGQRPNGRPQRVSASGRTQKEVRARLTELREARPAAAPAPSVRLLSAALISWLAIRSARLRPRTRTNYEIYVRRHLIPLLGHLPLGAVSRQHIDEFISVLLTQPTARGRPLSPTTVGHAVAILQCVFKDFLAWEWIERNPLASVRKPRADRWQTQPWSVEECGRFLAICSAEWYGPAFATCLFAGLRVGEMGALTRADIDLQRGEIRVSRQLQKGKQGWEWSPPKSRAGLRVVSFDPAGPFGDLVRGQLARADELLLPWTAAPRSVRPHLAARGTRVHHTQRHPH